MYPAWTEALARQHVVQLRSAAASAKNASAPAKNASAPPPSPRQRARWTLIHVGLWLAVPRNEPTPGWPLTISTMTSRLSTIAVDLVERLSQEPPSRLRQVAAATAGLAVERTHLADPQIDAALAAVRDDVPAAMPELLQVLA